jgi:hypothetical protein
MIPPRPTGPVFACLTVVFRDTVPPTSDLVETYLGFAALGMSLDKDE